MAYDGKVMRLALQRFEEDRQRRQAQYQERRERIFARQPRLREIDGELRSTMSRIITSALRHGTDPRSAVAVLRDENLSLQAEKRELLQKMGLPEDALEETPCLRPLRGHGLPQRPGVPLPAGLLRPGAAEGAVPDAGPGAPEL